MQCPDRDLHWQCKLVNLHWSLLIWRWISYACMNCNVHLFSYIIGILALLHLMKIEKCYFAKWQVATKYNVTKSRLHCTQYTEHMSWHKTSKLIFHGLNHWFFDHLSSFLFDNTQWISLLENWALSYSCTYFLRFED